MDKIGKSGVKFSQEKLEYFNSMHLRNRFDAFDQLDIKKATNSWRKMLLDHLPSELHPQIKRMNELKMKKIMELMKIRIHFFKDMIKHTYFFVDPEYDTQIATKFAKKLKQSPEVQVKILKDLKDRFSKFSDDSFSADSIHKECSKYLFENSKQGLKNEDVFFLLRYAITANPVGATIGDIMEIITKQNSIKRLEGAIYYIETEA